MGYSLKREVEKKERFVGGHRLCAGCGAGMPIPEAVKKHIPEV